MLNELLTTTSINLLLQEFINKALNWLPSDLRVQVETQAGTRPKQAPYVTLWWRKMDLLPQNAGIFKQDGSYNDGIENLDNETYCEVQITARGPRALSIAEQIRYALESTERQFDIYRLLGFAGCTEIQVIGAPYNGNIQQQAFFNFCFYAMFNREFPADWFDAGTFRINDKEKQLPEDLICP